jgi:AcrR family transcriptional regulator
MSSPEADSPPAPGAAPRPNKKLAQSQATRAKLIAAARGLFGAHGYAAVGTEAIVAAAGVTRGALYHQFADKRELFAAVVEEVEAEVSQRVEERALAEPDAVAMLRTGLAAWLDVCLEPEVSQIILIDAPAVLGWEAWRELGERYGVGTVMGGLQLGIDAGTLEPQPVRALAHIIIGAIDEAALYVARSEDREQAREEMLQVLARLVASMRAGAL